MTLSRTTVGKWHLISGTVNEVLTELDTAGIRTEMIAVMAEAGTSCIYRHGV
jgi:hypothetical protein